MANLNHVERLLQRAGWNKWRKDNPLIKPDLSGGHFAGVNLARLNLTGADLHGAHLATVDLSGSNLAGSNLSDAHLSDSNLVRASLIGANLTAAYLVNANLSGADIIKADLGAASLDGANLTSANLSGSRLIAARLTGVKLDNATLVEANFSRAQLDNSILRGANLTGANFTGAYLVLANLSQGNLRSVNLHMANLKDADLSEANLSGANLYRAILRDANLRKVNFEMANLNGAQLDGAYLNGANLWKSRRTGWSISNVICQYATMDGGQFSSTKFADGEFEYLYGQENDPYASDLLPRQKPIPKQVDAPIVAKISNHRLIRAPGRPIPKSAPVAGLSTYLASQFNTVAAELEGANTDRRIIMVFREAENLLENWTIANLLAFGTHLELVQSCASLLKHEVSDATAQRINAIVRSSRRFINSFEEWHAYVKTSVLFAVEVEGRGDEITDSVKHAAESLAHDAGTIDSGIASSLNELAESASQKESKQVAAVGIMSALRSVQNISITFAEYAAKAARTGFTQLTKNDRALKLMKAICRFQQHAVRLSAVYPDMAWMLNHEELFRAFCAAIGQEKKAE